MPAKGSGCRDVIIIGAGIGGLVAGGVLARAGLDVTILEAAGESGGLCRAIRGERLYWNLSLYSLRGCYQGGPFERLIEGLDPGPGLDFHHTRRAYLVIIDGEDFPITADTDEMLEAAGKLEAGGADGLRALLEEMARFNPVTDYPRLSGMTFAEAAARRGMSPKLVQAMGAPLMISLGLPPERASAYFTYLKYGLIFKGGLSYPAGGAGRLVKVLEDNFTRRGGELLLGRRASGISLASDRTKEVRTDDGLMLRGKYLVINADASWAMGELSGLLPPGWLERRKGLEPSLSARLFFMSAGAESVGTLGLDRYPHVVHAGTGRLAEYYDSLKSGGEPRAEAVFGLTSPATWEVESGWGRDRPVTAFFPAAAADACSARSGGPEDVERLMAGLNAGARVVKSVLPGDLERMTGNRGGAFCGWEMGPGRYGPSRLPQCLPVPGIYLAGHWTDPGPSVLNAALSGKKAAEMILKKAGPIIR